MASCPKSFISTGHHNPPSCPALKRTVSYTHLDVYKRQLDTSTMRIILIDGGPRLLSAFSPQSSDEVKKYLTHLGVEILVNQQVKNYENNMLVLDDGNFIESANVYWVAGVKANSLAGLPEMCIRDSYRSKT